MGGVLKGEAGGGRREPRGEGAGVQAWGRASGGREAVGGTGALRRS